MTTTSIHFDNVRPMARGPLTAISYLLDTDAWVRFEEVRDIADALAFFLDALVDTMESSDGLDSAVVYPDAGECTFSDTRLNHTRAVCSAASTLLCAIWGFSQVHPNAVREAGDELGTVILALADSDWASILTRFRENASAQRPLAKA